MQTEENKQGDTAVDNKSGGEEQTVDKFEVSKAEYDELVKDRAALGSLKREFKDLKKSIESRESETKDTPTKETKPEDSKLVQKLEKLALAQAGLTHQDDVDLARTTAKKWGMDIDEVLADEDFKIKLSRQQESRANVEATSGVKGSPGQGQAKLTASFWQAKGQPPTPGDIPDRKARQKIIRELRETTGNKGVKFYNE